MCLRLIVLVAINKKDMYGYELVAEVSKVVDVNEGTIYPLLKRSTNEHYFETYLRESTKDPPRKYYHLTMPEKYINNSWKMNGTVCKEV